MIGLFILGTLFLYLAFAVWIVKRQKTKRARWIAVAIFMLIPTWDEIVGRIYFVYLCETQSGIHVYKTVELPMEFWDANGEPRFITRDGLADGVMLSNRYDFSSEFHENYSRTFRIKRHAEVVTNQHTKELLGRYVRFIYFGGWVVNHTGAHVSGMGCPTIEEYNYRNYLKQVFRPVSARN